MNTSLDISNIMRLKNKHKENTSNNEVVPKYFMKIIEEFKDIHFIRYRKSQVKNYPTETYFFLVKTFIS